MMRTALTAGVLVGLLASGCAAPIPGTPRPTADVGPPLPARPYDIDLAGLDPCDGLTAEQLAALDVSGPFFTPDDGQGGDLCQWSTVPVRDRPSQGYLLEYDRRNDITTGPSSPRFIGVTEVQGFPAIQTQGEFAPVDKSCIVVVGVGPNQSVVLQFSHGSYAFPMTRDIACEMAMTASDLAMQTLLRTIGS